MREAAVVVWRTGEMDVDGNEPRNYMPVTSVRQGSLFRGSVARYVADFSE
jgi:hypothetical protein